MMSYLFLLIQTPIIYQLLFFSFNKAFVNVNAAHSRRRVSYRRENPVYDRDINLFTEDGRLAQVEYGLEASLRGSTIGAIRVPSEFLLGEDDSDLDSDSDELQQQQQGGGGVEGKTIVCICIENTSFGKMHRIDDHIWMLTAGLSGDARMLANEVRTGCQQHRLQYGEQPTTKQAARMTADFYHKLTRLGGCRPLGCTAILIGVSDEDYGGIAATRIFLADPGGGIEECQFCIAGKARSNLGNELKSLVAQFDSNKDNDKDDTATIGSLKSSSSISFIDSNSRVLNNSVKSIASKIADRFLTKLDEAKGTIGSTITTKIDVWTIQPMKHRRGEMLATCYSGVQKDNIQDTFSTKNK
mmetsp:Transcript_52397/g.58571  ORF Transcript_52397/g.58571 Transcript_52397/m.58571 type:complete len:356 (+) Transcript_52397:1-1068(+)